MHCDSCLLTKRQQGKCDASYPQSQAGNQAQDRDSATCGDLSCRGSGHHKLPADRGPDSVLPAADGNVHPTAEVQEASQHTTGLPDKPGAPVAVDGQPKTHCEPENSSHVKHFTPVELEETELDNEPDELPD